MIPKPSTEPTSSVTQPLSDAELYRVLSCPRRRLALEFLWDAAAPTPLTTLASAVAAAETGIDPAPRAAHESVATSLRQTHLPTLERHGLVTFDDGNPRATAAAKGVVRRIRDAGPLGIAWSDVYRWIGVAGLFWVVAALASAPVIGAVNPLGPAVASLAAYAAASAYHVWTLRPRHSGRGTVAAAADGWRPTES